ncbi:helix-hairpin-helix domain-containing protein [Psychroserpens sp.]|uniref:helix-hairpin-helix domain-containing protein n=1 Tax=Psychroserpens sp. TaxID=2020870 RepID=UPI001B18DD82|nr:helix-hairpin-helix domain-containing protein [Psychroserpens sp.]MBO6606108.1 helix-hairpin-helix domain-containing protein [Psychroserpens sp.]MBO6630616.1 helix-hairpin-helix domain-containing protein [Psychroserpens sp.]MBO6652521.1 helix-hairpin-helix domain-containing protein [Psychroserpens sp.]MBO6681707.1 helix-hairpin-helix domain-containing protein [Psychroserpens sp.]MBO6749482.1 helix-hairpin-helix domain-containing protein [Psychroserpens sp.]
MKNLKTVLVLGLLVICFLACKENKTDEVTTEQETAAAKETAPETTETVTITTVLNANLATEADLNGIGLSETMVTAIIDNRPFLSMTEFNTVLGSGDHSELYKQLFVPFNLNTTAEADFKMIPGVGNKMAHEFEEYRPYLSVKQFEREIGKYVDEVEVARYLNYVFVPVELNSASEEDIKALPGVGNKMAHEFEEYRPYKNMDQFRKEIGKYVDDAELKRLERFVYLKN